MPNRNAAALLIVLVARSVTQYGCAASAELRCLEVHNTHTSLIADKVSHINKVPFLDSLDDARHTHAVVRNVNLAGCVRAGVERADIRRAAFAALAIVKHNLFSVWVEARCSPQAINAALMRETRIDYFLHSFMPVE